MTDNENHFWRSSLLISEMSLLKHTMGIILYFWVNFQKITFTFWPALCPNGKLSFWKPLFISSNWHYGEIFNFLYKSPVSLRCINAIWISFVHLFKLANLTQNDGSINVHTLNISFSHCFKFYAMLFYIFLTPLVGWHAVLHTTNQSKLSRLLPKPPRLPSLLSLWPYRVWAHSALEPVFISFNVKCWHSSINFDPQCLHFHSFPYLFYL